MHEIDKRSFRNMKIRFSKLFTKSIQPAPKPDEPFPLLKLPNEILLLVLEHLPRKSLISLIRINRYAHDLLQSQLFRNLVVQSHDHIDAISTRLAEDDSLTPTVKSLYFDAKTSDGYSGLEFAAQFPNLAILEIKERHRSLNYPYKPFHPRMEAVYMKALAKAPRAPLGCLVECTLTALQYSDIGQSVFLSLSSHVLIFRLPTLRRLTLCDLSIGDDLSKALSPGAEELMAGDPLPPLSLLHLQDCRLPLSAREYDAVLYGSNRSSSVALAAILGLRRTRRFKYSTNRPSYLTTQPYMSSVFKALSSIPEVDTTLTSLVLDENKNVRLPVSHRTVAPLGPSSPMRSLTRVSAYARTLFSWPSVASRSDSQHEYGNVYSYSLRRLLPPRLRCLSLGIEDDTEQWVATSQVVAQLLDERRRPCPSLKELELRVIWTPGLLEGRMHAPDEHGGQLRDWYRTGGNYGYIAEIVGACKRGEMKCRISVGGNLWVVDGKWVVEGGRRWKGGEVNENGEDSWRRPYRALVKDIID